MLFRTAPSRSSGVVFLLALVLSAAVLALAARQLTGDAGQRQAVLEAQVSSVHFLLNRLHYSYTDAVQRTYNSNDSDEQHAAKAIRLFNHRYNLGRNPAALHGSFALTPRSLGYEDEGMLKQEACAALSTHCWGGWMSGASGFHFYVHFPSASLLRAVLQRMRQDVARQDVVFCAVTPAELRQTLATLTFRDSRGEQRYWTFPDRPSDSEASPTTCTASAAEADWAQFSTGNLSEYPGSVLLGTYRLPEALGGVRSVSVDGDGTITVPSIRLRKLTTDRLKFYKVDVSSAHTRPEEGRYSVHGRDVVRIRRRFDPIKGSSPKRAGNKWVNLYDFSSCYANPWPVQEVYGGGEHSYDVYDGAVVQDRYKPFNCGRRAGSTEYEHSEDGNEYENLTERRYNRVRDSNNPNRKSIKWRYTMPVVHTAASEDEPKIENLGNTDIFGAFSRVGGGADRKIWPNDRQGNRGSGSREYFSRVLESASLPQAPDPDDTAAAGPDGKRVRKIGGGYREPRLRHGPEHDPEEENGDGEKIGLMRHVNSLLGSPTVDPSHSRHWPSIDKPMKAWQYHHTQGWKKQSEYNFRPLYMPAYQPNCAGKYLVSGGPSYPCQDWLDSTTRDQLRKTSYLVTRSVALHLAHQVFAPGVKRRPRFRRGHNVGKDYYVASSIGGREYSPARKAKWLPKLKQKDPTSSDDYKDVTRIYGGAAAARMKIHRLYGAVHLQPNFMRHYLNGSTRAEGDFLHGPPSETSDFAWNWNGTCDAWGDSTNPLPAYDPMNPDPRHLYTDEYDRDSPDHGHSVVRTKITTMEDTPMEKSSHPQCPTYLYVDKSAVIFSEAIIFDTATGKDNTAVKVAVNTQTERLNELWPIHSERAGTASLEAIRPYSYRPKFAASAFLPEGISSGSTEDIGFLAQEIQAYYPEAVFQHKGLLSISYYSLLPALWSHLTEARQRHRQRMAQLTGRIERLRLLLGDAGDCAAGHEVCR